MKRTVVISDNQMKLARKLNMGRKPVLFAVVILSLAAESLHGQDILKSNPEFWGRNAFQSNSATAGAHPSPKVGDGQNADAVSQTAGADPQHRTVSHQATPNQITATVNAARDAEKNGDVATARTLYQQALQYGPTHRMALLSFARMLHRSGELDASIEMYYRALEHHRDDPVAMNDLALCYARKGELRHALAMMNGAISLKPDSVRYRNNIAKLLLELNRPTDAFSHLVEANGPAVGHYNMAKLLGQRGQTADAIQYLEIAIQMDPKFEPASLLLQQVRAQPQATTAAAPANVFTRLPAVGLDDSKKKPVKQGNPTSAIAAKANPTNNRTPSTKASAENSDSTAPPPKPSIGSIAKSETVSPKVPLKTTPLKSAPLKTASLNNASTRGMRQDTNAAGIASSNTRSSDGQNDVRSPWKPGSIRLQSAELVDELNEGAVDWAVDFEELELAPTSAPIPFENRRRYTEEKNSTDSVGKFLDGFK